MINYVPEKIDNMEAEWLPDERTDLVSTKLFRRSRHIIYHLATNK